MRAVIEEKPRSDDHPRAQREAGLPTMPAIVTTVARTFGVDADTIRHGNGGPERMLVAWLGCYEGMHRLRTIAASLRLRSSGRASDLIRICDAELDREPLLRIAADRCCDLLRGSPRPGRHPIVPGVTANIPTAAI
ncbi:MAG: hypothetical protein ABI718_00010 [Acidobacteriota bacterium]